MARKPQTNAIIKRVHQTIGQMIRTFEVQEMDNVNDPFKGVLTVTSFAVRAMVHTTLQSSPTQLVFGREHMLNIKHEADWKSIKERKQKLIDKNNEMENRKRRKYTYEVGQKVLVKLNHSRKFGDNPYKGPYEVVALRDNGTIGLRSPLG